MSKVYVRNYYNQHVKVIVHDLWLDSSKIKATHRWVKYSPQIMKITNTTYQKLTDSIEILYDNKGTLVTTIPAHSTVLLEMMPNAAPSYKFKMLTVVGNEREEYDGTYIKRKKFHKYYIDIKP